VNDETYMLHRRGMGDNEVAVETNFRLRRNQHATPRVAHKMDLT